MHHEAAGLAAAILGVDPQSLRVHERRRQRLRVATVVVAAVTAMASSLLALNLAAQKSNLAAQDARQARLNVAQHLLAAASHAGPVDEQLLLAAAAYRVAPGSPARYGLAEDADLNPGLRRVLRVPPGGIGTVWSVGYSPDGRLLAAAASSPSSDAVVVVWPGRGTGQPAEVVMPAAAVATSVTFSPDGRLIAVGDSSGGITLITVSPGRAWPPRLTTGSRLGPPRRPGPGKAGQVNRVSFAADGKRLAASYSNGVTAVWQLATHGVVASFPGTASQFWHRARTATCWPPAQKAVPCSYGT